MGLNFSDVMKLGPKFAGKHNISIENCFLRLSLL